MQFTENQLDEIANTIYEGQRDLQEHWETIDMLMEQDIQHWAAQFAREQPGGTRSMAKALLDHYENVRNEFNDAGYYVDTF